MATITIQSGQTLSGIAAQYGTTIQALMAANPHITNANLIYAGASLTIPSTQSTNTQPTTQSSSNSQGVTVNNGAYTYQGASYAFGTGPLASSYPSTTNLPKSTTTTAPTTGASGATTTLQQIMTQYPNLTQAQAQQILSVLPQYNGSVTQAIASLNIPVTDTATSGSSSTSSTISYNSSLANYGITQSMFIAGTPQMKATWLAMLEGITTANAAPVSSVTYQEALTAAQNDSTITQPYADSLNMSVPEFNQTLQQIQQALATTSSNQQVQFQQNQAALQQQTMAAGQAYSGFRGLAQQQLNEQEGGIVQSTSSQLQESLNNATQSYESLYGSSATPNASASYTNPITGVGQQYTGNIVSGITGSQITSEQSAEQSAAATGVQSGILPGTT